MKKVIAVLLPGKHNQNTGAFTQALKALIKNGHYVDLITNEENASLFGPMDDADTHIIGAKTSALGIINLFNYINTQMQLFGMILKIAKAGTPVYISSIHPFTAAIAGKIKNANVIYHLEDAAVPMGLKQRFMNKIANRTASQVIFTSLGLKQYLALTVKKQTVVYPALPAEAAKAKHTFTPGHGTKDFTVSMITPAQPNKGIKEFLSLAAAMPHIKFELNITGDASNIKNYITNKAITANLAIMNRQDNMNEFYERASVVVNLSMNKARFEACDTNILQAMHYGKPVIVPSNGGTKEFINTKKHGVTINSNHLDAITDTINILHKNAGLYNSMSAACKQQAALFNPEHFEKQIVTLFKGRPQSIYNTLDQLFGSTFFNANFDQFGNRVAA